ncbi:MAG: dihydropteroate synthase, partial [Acidobacteriia bacterium]|nr:dihydropteroate synthase [Terriglobia bacterium]
MFRRPKFDLQLGRRKIVLGERTLVMGVVNVTPDSFSDGGLYLDPDKAIAHGVELARQGADWLDIGGESTRPGSKPVPPEEELRRVLPVIRMTAARGSAARMRSRRSIPVTPGITRSSRTMSGWCAATRRRP